MKKTIKNRKDQDLVLNIDISKTQTGLVFILHGLGGFKEQEHIQAFAKAFRQNDFSVVNIDAANSLGESGGRFEEASVTNHYQDLEDAIKWAKSQKWYQEPFALAGHSLGALSTALYAENYPDEVMASAPISLVVSGELSWEAHKKFKPKEFEQWKESGWLEKDSKSKPGIKKRLPWSHMEDRLKYDLMKKIDNLTMPVILIVGQKDISTPPDQQIIFYENLPGAKEIHIIEDVEHSFRNKDGEYDNEALEKVCSLISSWIKKWHK